MLERDIAEFEYRNGRVTRSYYQRFRNLATNLIKKTKHDYMQPKFHVSLGSKSIWRNLRGIGVISSGSVKPSFTASEFNRYLTRLIRGSEVSAVNCSIFLALVLIPVLVFQMLLVSILLVLSIRSSRNP